jgi:hypothetical protein
MYTLSSKSTFKCDESIKVMRATRSADTSIRTAVFSSFSEVSKKIVFSKGSLFYSRKNC